MVCVNRLPKVCRKPLIVKQVASWAIKDIPLGFDKGSKTIQLPFSTIVRVVTRLTQRTLWKDTQFRKYMNLPPIQIE